MPSSYTTETIKDGPSLNVPKPSIRGHYSILDVISSLIDRYHTHGGLSLVTGPPAPPEPHSISRESARPRTHRLLPSCSSIPRLICTSRPPPRQPLSPQRPPKGPTPYCVLRGHRWQRERCQSQWTPVGVRLLFFTF